MLGGGADGSLAFPAVEPDTARPHRSSACVPVGGRPRPAPRALVWRDRRRKGGSVTRRVGGDKDADTRGPCDRDREGCGCSTA
jgi:hypothetical protein